MTDLVTHAQLVLLARTLHVPVRRVAHLERLGARHLHEIQQRMAAIVFEQHTEVFARISKLVPIIPLGVSMPLVQRFVPPTMTGRAAGSIGVEHPKKAADIIAVLGTSYAADCVPYIDPRTIATVAEHAPWRPIAEILNEILRRGDYITAGPFLEYLNAGLIDAVEFGVHDDAGVIFSAAYAYSSSSVSAILRRLSSGRRQRVPRIVHTVLHGSAELQRAGLSTFARCEPDVIASVGEVLFRVGNAQSIGNLVVTAIRVGAVEELLTFADQLTPAAKDTLAGYPVFGNEAVLTGLIGALESSRDPIVWHGLFEILRRNGPELGQRAARMLADLPDETVAALPSIAAEADLWRVLLRVLAAADATVHERIGAVWATLPPERLSGLELHIHELDLGQAVSALTEQISTASMEEVFFRRRQRSRHRDSADDGWPLS
ncbi:hypothetical protein [Nocardia callitridis]|uniref:Uncharacterized protein n=1 Tax=Nocardia callitridis TaxID=648753 RepID=A0ABP9KG52_9NOCA